jgi:hypothetical protein
LLVGGNVVWWTAYTPLHQLRALVVRSFVAQTFQQLMERLFGHLPLLFVYINGHLIAAQPWKSI